ncbi:MAG TPA: hypothetical protein VHE78_08555, partial [Gemmatimonadaceae bacterium]|nr:hypothetical protein [Gemmatimonadaceae bacterium]
TMAWWGEAMAWNYGVWNTQFPDSARATLARLGPTPAARASRARTPRERDYLQTVEVLYGTATKAHRDTAYATAAARLSQKYPQDDEAKLFYALAVLGLNQGVRDVPTYERALAIAMDVFRRHPDHPGASHYVIHASDDPAHATVGLEAARALAKSSPAAEHAQHMTSHTFLALGMWDDVVAANERATHADSAMPPMPGMRRYFCGHANSWLDYGYLSQGRVAAAASLLQQCQAIAARVGDRTRAEDTDPDNSLFFSAVAMWSRYLFDTEQWSSTQAQWEPAVGSAPGPRRTYSFARAFAAARRGDLAVARAGLTALQTANRDAKARVADAHDGSPETVEDEKRANILDLELQAAIQSAEGKHDEAIGLLRQATVIEDGMAYAFGPPNVDKPSHELLGEELLVLKRGSEARTEFEWALKRTPRRPLALRGLALSNEAAGRPAEATAAWRELVDVWHTADATLPGVVDARRRVAR